MLPLMRYDPLSRRQIATISGYVSGRGASMVKVFVTHDGVRSQEFEGYIHTTSDDPAASHIPLRTPLLDVGSPCALTLAKKHIDECGREHDRCKAVFAFPDPRLPTRLVDCEDPTKARLVSMTGGSDARYLALSYVWGPREDQHQCYESTASNILKYEQGIEVSLLPKTIQDAICVTHALGFRFLWVDALCIIQDRDEDKQHELRHMHHIYLHASLTIIAASAAQVGEGFLHDRLPPRPLDLVLPFICDPCPPTSAGDPVDCVTAEQVGTVRITEYDHRVHSYFFPEPYSEPWPLSNLNIRGPTTTRGWCMQEALLSPRSLVFGPTTVQFRCQTTLQNVGYPGTSHVAPPLPIPSMLFLLPPPPAEIMLMAWRAAVMDYSNRAVTDPLDKLVACAAVAECFHRVLHSEYLAGLWREGLLSHLLWYRSGEGARARHRREYRAPSWSWASIDGAVEWSTSLRAREVCKWEHDPLAKVVKCCVKYENSALPFGRVTDGTIVLRAALLRCHRLIIREELGASYYSLGYYPPRRTRTRELCYQMVLQPDQWSWQACDIEAQALTCSRLCAYAQIDDVLDDQIENLWAIPLEWSDRHGHTMDGLIVTLLAPADSNSPGAECDEPEYRRVGCFHRLEYPSERGYNASEDMMKHSSEKYRALQMKELRMVDIKLK